VQSLTEFVRATLVTCRGLPDREVPVEEQARLLDERMATTEVLTWGVVTGAALVGATSFVRLRSAAATTPASTLIVRSTVCTWSLVAIALAKLWHQQAQDHTATMKGLLLARELGG